MTKVNHFINYESIDFFDFLYPLDDGYQDMQINLYKSCFYFLNIIKHLTFVCQFILTYILNTFRGNMFSRFTF